MTMSTTTGPKDSACPPLSLGVVGAGAMGRGIAQVAALAGCPVALHDLRPGAAAEAVAAIADSVSREVAKGRLSAHAAAEAMERLRPLDGLADLAGCAVVIEAIVENLDAKRALIAALEDHLAPDAVIATNTSSLSVTALAAAARHPGRVAGFHFFNPVPVMRLVEVVDGLLTDPAVTDTLCALAIRFGHQPVRAKDSPGFIVNHAGRGLTTEALAIAGEGVAAPAVIDRILTGALGFRLGPFALMDFTGLDVSLPVMETIYAQYQHEPRYRPGLALRQRVEAGLLGRKSGRGFHSYAPTAATPSAPPGPPAAPPANMVWVAPGAFDADLAALCRRLGARLADGPAPGVPCLVTPLGGDCTAEVVRLGLDPHLTLAVDGFAGLDRHRTVMTNPGTDAAVRDTVCALLGLDGVPVEVIGDSPGFVTQRVLAMIVAIAADIAQKGIARPADIDRAVTLGLAYPAGPLAWGDRVGAARILAILEAIQDLTGDPRYRPGPWLRRRAALGLSLLHEEQVPGGA